MADKGLKSLSKSELLELLLAQTRENERLRRDLLEAQQQLRDRWIRLKDVGDLASAVMEVNGVMAAAQAAAKQYLDNIAEMERETKLSCQRMLAQAQEEAALIRKGVMPVGTASAPKPVTPPPTPKPAAPALATTPAGIFTETEPFDDDFLTELHKLLEDKTPRSPI